MLIPDEQSDPGMIRSQFYTHYSYLCGPNNMRVPEDFFDLSASGADSRRRLIGELLDCGRLLAKLPEQFQIAPDRDDLERYLNGDFS